jgi:hypothetical protein
MKTKNYIIFSIGICALFVTVQSGFSQGTLTPPGAPAQTMKSLDQIEPRTPIAYAGSAINYPGSYYLTTNVVGFAGANGIGIYSGNVTLDLNGFTVQGVSGSYSGIYIGGSYTNITVRNGTVTGWGEEGVTWNHPNLPGPQSVVLEHLIISANGFSGIATANGYVVSDCSIENNAGAGIAVLGNGSQIIGNTLVGNNTANSANSGGIVIEGLNNRIEGNHITGSGTAGYGIAFNFYGDTNNIIVKNSVSGNGANNYSTAGGSGNDYGPIGTAASSTSPWANISH